MKVVFISNYFNHHQKYLCDALYNMNDIRFNFISTSEMREERRKMGYDKIELPSYVIHWEKNEEKDKAQKIVDEADAVICGFPPKEMLRYRVKKNKVIFYYTERPLKSAVPFLIKLKTTLSWRLRAPRKKNIYLLSASAYAPYDYSTLKVFNNKTFRFGYFPEAKEYTSFSEKEQSTILWCGRLLGWKRPLDAANAALNLKNQGYSFKMKLIGNGEEEEKLKSFINENNLSNFVEMCGFLPPEQIRSEMEKSSIYLFTSNKQEGWGAVLNESMNSGCAVIASHAAGSSRYLIEDEENGLIYQSGNVEMLTDKLKTLLDSPETVKKLGVNAYKTITEKWNAETAAKRFIILAKSVLNQNKTLDLFPDGPCSIAPVISDEWQK